MREIKFKAKRLDDNSWVFGYFYEENDNTYIIENRQKESKLNRNLSYQVDPSTVCQFTGLKDCEGNEIWEHDLLQSQKTKAIYEVVWDEGDFTLSDYVVGVETMIFLCSALRISRIKVIGNKFDKEK